VETSRSFSDTSVMDNESRRAAVQKIFSDAEFISHLGIRLKDVGDGWCHTELRVRPEHAQQHGSVHAGVISTLADHTAGGAARAALDEHHDVLTIEFKINFLRPGTGDRLEGEGKALRAGRRVVVAESEVYAYTEGNRVLIAKCISTLAVITQK
jgi:uncharacterized protein (TIGR00369 family)